MFTKSNFDLLPEDDYDLEIATYKITKSKHTGRYGCLFLLHVINEPKSKSFFFTIWFGNYKDFRKDDREKSTYLWRRAKKNSTLMGIKIKNILKNKKLKTSFFGEVKQDKIYFWDQNYNEQFITQNYLRFIY